jgi:hypothetical protein
VCGVVARAGSNPSLRYRQVGRGLLDGAVRGPQRLDDLPHVEARAGKCRATAAGASAKADERVLVHPETLVDVPRAEAVRGFIGRLGASQQLLGERRRQTE